MKTFAKILLGLVVVLALAFFLLKTPDTDAAAMHAKYGGALALYADDGVGGKIHYRDQGRRDGPVLLLLHGANGSLHTWEGVIELLGSQYRILSYDQHGHGLTGPQGEQDYSALSRIDAGLRVLDAAGVEKAVWVGSSMGGWVSWRAALAVPERLSGLVLIDISGAQTDEKITPYLGARLAQTFLGQLLMPKITPRPLIKSSLLENYVDKSKVSEELVTRYWELIRYPGNRQAAAAAINTSREPEMWQHVSSITAPTLILWGEQDSVIPLSHGVAFNEAIIGSRLQTYLQAGHLPMEEIPEQVAFDIANWLRQ